MSTKPSQGNAKSLKSAKTGVIFCSRFNASEESRLSELFHQHAVRDKIKGEKKMCLKMKDFEKLCLSMFGLNCPKIVYGVFRCFDFNDNKSLTEDEFIIGVSVMVRGPIEERVPFVWTVYDTQEDGHLSRSEMYHFLQDSIVGKKDSEDVADTTKELIESLFRQLDVNGDGHIDFVDFYAAVTSRPLLLECLGQVFPSPSHVQVFETVFASDLPIDRELNR